MAETPKFELPAIVRERLQAAATTAPHPEPDVLAAFSERTLPEAERETVLAHLSACDRCREVLALIAPEEGPPRVAASAIVERAGFSWRALRWGALAAALALAAAVTIPRLERTSPSQTVHVRIYSANAPAVSPAKEEAETKSPAAVSPITSDKVAASRGAQSQSTALSRLDQFDAKAKSEISANGRGMLDRALTKSRVLANGAPALEANNAVPMVESPNRNGVAAFGSVAGGMIRSKQAAAPLPAAPASQPNGAESYATSETVAVTNAAPAVHTETANIAPTANEPAMKKDQTQAAAQKEAPAPAKTAVLSERQSVFEQQQDLSVAQAQAIVVPQWRVRHHRVQESLDQGMSWSNQQIAGDTKFRSVLAEGNSVWAGGEGKPSLYHSPDGGRTWTAIDLGSDVVKVRLTEPPEDRAIVIYLSNGTQMTPIDADGSSWKIYYAVPH